MAGQIGQESEDGACLKVHKVAPSIPSDRQRLLESMDSMGSACKRACKRERGIYARRPCIILQRGIVGRVFGVKITRIPYLLSVDRV